MSSFRDRMHDARRALGVTDLVLTVHDASFPARAEYDVGRGSPYGKGADDLLEFADELGFTGLQLGPQGETSRVNRSPYDGTVFSKSVLSVAFDRLEEDPAWRSFVDEEVLAASLGEVPEARDRMRGRAQDNGIRVAYESAWVRQREAVQLAYARFERIASPELRARFAAFETEAAPWLAHDALYEARATLHGTDDARAWPPHARLDAGAILAGRVYAFGQFVVHGQHDALRGRLARRGCKLWGDLQVGLSSRDQHGRDALFLEGYRMGAPTSRTEPLGQAWGYRVLDPRSPFADAFFRRRVEKASREFDGLRVDHPHGLTCPWVYRDDDPDPLRAVANGARLFASPDLADHPKLAAYAVARPDQIDRSAPRSADGWVTSLTDDQISQYAQRLDEVVRAVRSQGRSEADVMCEVLSTCPFPLERVLERHRLGRFRVTQKANPTDPRDVYRAENADPEDWIMTGNHDTPPLPCVLDRWAAEGVLKTHAAYLASQLADDAGRDAFMRDLLTSRRALTRALTAQLFSSPARHVSVFFADLFGLRDRYNRPGVVDDLNWTLRVPRDFRAAYAAGVVAGDAMDLPRAFAMALSAKEHGAGSGGAHAGLIEALL